MRSVHGEGSETRRSALKTRNLNKLFPRLPIRVKLVVVFAFLVTVPLVVTGAFGTRETLRHIEASARTSLVHDLETTSERTEHFLLGAEEDLAYLTESTFAPALDRLERGVAAPEAEERLRSFLALKQRFFQVRLLDPYGEPLLSARAGGTTAEAVGGVYYVYRARSLAPGQRAVLAVEVRDEPGREARITAVPAIAIVQSVRNADGELRAVVAGELYAARLFEAIESGSPNLRGTTGVVDANGQYIYHSRRKRDWNTLLATRTEAELATEIGPVAGERVLAGEHGTVRSRGGDLVSFRALRLQGPDGRPLRLYREVPASVIVAPARSFLRIVGAGGTVVFLVAMALAFVAATQFTRPIRRLREAARRIAGGEYVEPPSIETNDEIEDLAHDFSEMAMRLREHRQRLEDRVAARTVELRDAHAELAEILANTEDAILKLDPDGRVRVWNRGAERLFGHRREDATGRRLEDLVGGWDPDAVARTATFLDRRVDLKRADGTVLEASVSRTAIRSEDGELIGYTVIVRDETMQRELERQMLRSERLSAAGRLASGVVHEINNPIGIIVNRLDLLDTDIDERCRECFARSDLRVIRHQADRVGAVARRLLALARTESEDSKPLDVNELASGVAAFLRPELRKRDLELEVNLEPDLPLLQAIAQDIETVLLNLALNAMDASEPGGVVRLVTRREKDGRAVAIEVADQGTGIDPEVEERIFEPFFTTKVQPRGTGLGLTVSQGVVQVHGGEIRVVSEPGAGTVFTVVLPAGAEFGS